MAETEPQEINLDRFYYGTLQVPGAPGRPAPEVIAHTPGVTPAQVDECLRVAPINAPGEDGSGAMPGTLALFRAETLEYVLAKAQPNQAGDAQTLFILMPAAALRLLNGNVLAFRSLALMEMPTFSAVRPNLLPFELRPPAPPTPEAQIDSLLDLLTYCDDSPRVVEAILAGLIQRQPVLITGSPASLDLRLRFVQGLLNLLPPPARLGVTFATHVAEGESSPAQLKFAGAIPPADGHVVFDWSSGRLLTPPAEAAYSRYIVTQLRLDPALVVEQTERFARTTMWRGLQRDSLDAALAWVSRRAALDHAVITGQPADTAAVAQVLRDDPTLPSELRQRYVRHVLAFALALDDATSADVVPVVSAADAGVARAAAEHLRAALSDGETQTVYALIERWLLHVPEASALPWHRLLHVAAHGHLTTLVAAGEFDRAVGFLDHLAGQPAALRFDEIQAELVRSARPAALGEQSLARTLFLCAVRTLPPADLFEFIDDAELGKLLPAPAQQALSYLQLTPRRPVPPDVLELGARAFEGDAHTAVLSRLVECAALRQRAELITTRGLEAVLSMTRLNELPLPPAVQPIVQAMAYTPILLLLEPPGPRLLAQLLLQTHEFDRAVTLLEFYQSEVYGPDGLDEFAQLAGDLFAAAALSAEALTSSVMALEGSHIRPVPRAAMLAGALHNRAFSVDQQYEARQLTSVIFGDHSLIDAVGYETALDLLSFHARRRNAFDALRVMAALVDYAIPLGVRAGPIMVEAWSQVAWDDPVRQAALELLRRYVRAVPRAALASVVGYLSSALGGSVAQALEATALLRAVLDDCSLGDYVKGLHLTTLLLLDLTRVFHTDREIPPHHRLRRDLDTMTGGISEEERRAIADDTLELARNVVALTRGQRRGSGVDAVRSGRTMPQGPLDLLVFLGGQLGAAEMSELDDDLAQLRHMFGTRSAAMVHREVAVAARHLRALRQAFEGGPLPSAPEALASEIRSLWDTLTPDDQRQRRSEFAHDCQQLALVLRTMTHNGANAALGGGGLGRELETGQRAPRTGVEALRWVSGYFARKHTSRRFG